MAMPETQLGIDWTRDTNAPVSGRTPAARHASSTGAMAIAPKAGTLRARMLAAFRQHGKLTIAECAVITGIKETTVCARWKELETAGWIVGTATFQTYRASGRVVRREWHELTARGREIAESLR